jgi:hypothetical protein
MERKENTSLKRLYEHKCSCGKLLQDHKLPDYCSTTNGWEILKIYYDLGTCNINKKIYSRPNGFTKLRSYSFTPFKN